MIQHIEPIGASLVDLVPEEFQLKSALLSSPVEATPVDATQALSTESDTAQRAPRAKCTFFRNIKRGLRNAWSHPALRVLREYCCGLGSCVVYHRVKAAKYRWDEFSPYSGLSVAPDRFEEQICFFRKNFNCLALEDAVSLLKVGKLPPRTLTITFDDGYKDNLTAALPILEKYEVPATIYVTTGFIERTAQLWWYEQEFIVRRSNRLEFEWNGREYDWHLGDMGQKYVAIERLNSLFKTLSLRDQNKLMKALRSQCAERYCYDDEILDWDEIERLDRHPLITIGAHTNNHPALSRLEVDELVSEISESKLLLQERLGHEVRQFAYPFGGRSEVGEREVKMARECGFQSAVTTRQGHLFEEHTRSLHRLPRIAVNADDNLDSVTWKLSGLYSLLQPREPAASNA